MPEHDRPTNPYSRHQILRDHAEAWLARAQNVNLRPDERAGCLRMARQFLDWARQEDERG
jgi:hypothetical protein